MSKQTFKFPTGDFSHTDFAKLNGVTNQQVWTVYSAARKSGQIIPATPPERKNAGKGKPTLMWIVNPNYVAPVVPVTPATPATPAVPTTATVTPALPATPPVVLTDEQIAAIAQQQAADRAAKEAAKLQAKADKEAAKVAAKAAKDAAKAQAKLDKAAAKAAAKAAKEAAAVPTEPVTVAAATPATAPVETVTAPAVVETVTVPVVEVVAETTPAPLAEVAPASAPAEQPFVVAAVVAEAPVEVSAPVGETFQGRPVTDTREINETCPICGSKCLAANNDTGVYVWCAAPIEVCKASENPYGHANNEKAAYAILVAKYGNKS